MSVSPPLFRDASSIKNAPITIKVIGVQNCSFDANGVLDTALGDIRVLALFPMENSSTTPKFAGNYKSLPIHPENAGEIHLDAESRRVHHFHRHERYLCI